VKVNCPAAAKLATDASRGAPLTILFGNLFHVMAAPSSYIALGKYDYSIQIGTRRTP